MATLALLAGCAVPQSTPLPAARPAATGAAAAAATAAVPVSNAFRAAVAAGTRTEHGEPGEAYWQQRVSYRIEADLDPRMAELRGRERIVYHNRSPDALPYIALNLYQNVFSEGVPRNRFSPVTGGITLERVAAQGTTLERGAWSTNDATPRYAVQGTVGRVHLPRPLAPGDSLVLEINWHFTVPPEGTYRTAWQDALGGRAFVIAQWYPQIATYDDLRGWDETPYLGDGEFYLEYGDFEVALTVPEGWLVGASGELLNPEVVLREEQLARLAAALEGDGTTRIVTREDLEAGTVTRLPPGLTLTWRFRAENVRDFAFATSDRYVWDVAPAEVPTGRGGTRVVPINALYRPGAPHWERAAEFGSHAIEHISRDLIAYPYRQVTITEGSVGGMEYPQVMFIGKPQQVEALYGVIAHEAVHFWFPMLVGSDEARHAWMDEGMASYYGDRAGGAFFGDDDAQGGNLRSYLAVAGSDAEVPLMRHTDLVTPYGARGVAAYTKPAVLFGSLRSLLGADRFDAALREYIRDWSYRHPAPWDFFNAMETATGSEMDWFFGPWWYGTGTLDQAIERVEQTAGGARVTVANLGEIAMPVHLVATTSAGEDVRVTVPVGRWEAAGTLTVDLAAPSSVVRVEIDPENMFPDVDRRNNVWSSGGS